MDTTCKETPTNRPAVDSAYGVRLTSYHLAIPLHYRGRASPLSHLLSGDMASASPRLLLAIGALALLVMLYQQPLETSGGTVLLDVR